MTDVIPGTNSHELPGQAGMKNQGGAQVTGTTERFPTSVSEVLLPLTGAPRRARQIVAEACLRWDLPHLIEPASLIANELVTNAVCHAETLVDLQAIHGRRYLLIQVGDGSTAIPAGPTPPATIVHDQLTSGRGLILVETTADRWGYRHIAGGKIVWAALRQYP